MKLLAAERNPYEGILEANKGRPKKKRKNKKVPGRIHSPDELGVFIIIHGCSMYLLVDLGAAEESWKV